MNPETFLLFFGVTFYVLIVCLMLYHIEKKWNPLGRFKCRLGVHTRVRKDFGRNVKKYHCVFCGKVKNHPRLEIIDGDKKEFISRRKW